LSTQALSGNSFSFNNASNTGTGISFSWNFGSGATAASYTGLNPTVSYNKGTIIGNAKFVKAK